MMSGPSAASWSAASARLASGLPSWHPLAHHKMSRTRFQVPPGGHSLTRATDLRSTHLPECVVKLTDQIEHSTPHAHSLGCGLMVGFVTLHCVTKGSQSETIISASKHFRTCSRTRRSVAKSRWKTASCLTNMTETQV